MVRARVTILDVPDYGNFVWFPGTDTVRFYKYGRAKPIGAWLLMPSRRTKEGAILLACRQLPYILEGDERL